LGSCTREIVAWHVELRCRADEAIALIERAAAADALAAGELTLGSDKVTRFSLIPLPSPAVLTTSTLTGRWSSVGLLEALSTW
jgi:hypothetical protein